MCLDRIFWDWVRNITDWLSSTVTYGVESFNNICTVRNISLIEKTARLTLALPVLLGGSRKQKPHCFASTVCIMIIHTLAFLLFADSVLRYFSWV